MENTERQLKAIMFSDVKSFSAMMGEDEERTIRLVKEHREIVREILARHHGEEHGTAGDSFFVLFSSAVEAVRCAVETQEAFHRRNAGQPEGEQIWIRIGIHIGDILIDRVENRVYGDGINIAARTEPLAEPGGICITRDVYQQVRNKLEVRAVCIGRKEMKNILDAPELYQLVVGQAAERNTGAGGDGRRFRHRRVPAWIPAVGVVVVVAALVGGYLLRGDRSQVVKPVTTPAVAMTVTVLPFDNLSRNESLAWLGVGLSQGISDRLQEIRQLKVRNPPDVQVTAALAGKFSGDALAREMGRVAEARWVVAGNFVASGQDVEVTAKVMLVQDGSVLKVVERQGKVDAVLALQKDIVLAIVSDLLPGIKAREEILAAREMTKSDPAFQAMSRARELFRRDGSATPQNFKMLKYLLEESIRLDPDYTAPRNLLASILLFQGGSSVDIPMLREALVQADAVVRLSPENRSWPFAQRCRIRAALGMYSLAVEDCGKARQIDPDAYYEPGLYEAVEQFDHEERLLNDLVRLEAENYWPWYSLGGFLMRQGRLDEALKPLQEAVRLHDESLAAGAESAVRKSGWLEPVGAHAMMGKLLLAGGDLDGAAKAFQGELDRLSGRTHVYKAVWSAICQGNLSMVARLQNDSVRQAGADEALQKLVADAGPGLLVAVAQDLASYKKASHLEPMLEQALSYAAKAVEMDGRKNPFFLDLLADIHEKLGHRDIALAVNAEGQALLPECESFGRRAKRLAVAEAR